MLTRKPLQKTAFQRSTDFVQQRRSRMKAKPCKHATRDAAFSRFIRERDGRCLICGTTENLTCSHFHNRRKVSVRFDPDNCDTFCLSDHQRMETEKFEHGEYWEWKLNQLGLERFEALELRARIIKRQLVEV